MASRHRRNTTAMLESARCGARTRAGTPCKAPAVTGGAGQITSFVSGKVYHDFSPDVVSTFTPTGGGTAAELRTGNLGTYGEVSLGLDYVKPLASGKASPAGQLGAALGLTGQFSGKVYSVGLSARLWVGF